jgi:hypothetical protein
MREGYLFREREERQREWIQQNTDISDIKETGFTI